MSAVGEIAKTICHQCYAVLDVGDRFCRQCGAPLVKTTEDPRPPDQAGPDLATQPAESCLGHSMVLAGLVLLFGPLALPMLWRSRRFPAAWKMILTGLVLAATLLVVLLVWYVFYRSLEPLRQLHQLQGR